MAQLERLLLAAEFSTPQKEVDALLRALNTLIVAANGWAGEDLGVKVCTISTIPLKLIADLQ